MAMRKFILLILLIFLVWTNCFAYDFMENGLAYNIKKDGTLALTYNNPKVWKAMNEAQRERDVNEVFKKVKAIKWWEGGYEGNITVPATVKHKGRTYKVTEIGDSAFKCCEQLKSVKISEGIKRIGYAAFYSVKITSIYIPASVTEIKPGSFVISKQLMKVTVSPANKKYCSLNNCIYNKKMTALYLVGSAVRNYTIPTSVTTLLDYAFSCTRKMNKLVIPRTVKFVGGNVGDCIEVYKVTSRSNAKIITPESYKGAVPGYFICPYNVTGNYHECLKIGGEDRRYTFK